MTKAIRSVSGILLSFTTLVLSLVFLLIASIYYGGKTVEETPPPLLFLYLLAKIIVVISLIVNIMQSFDYSTRHFKQKDKYFFISLSIFFVDVFLITVPATLLVV